VKAGDQAEINQSHCGSGAQSRAVLEGLPDGRSHAGAASDIDALAKHGLLVMDWHQRLPDNSALQSLSAQGLEFFSSGNRKQAHLYGLSPKAIAETRGT
jgi:ABC-type sulfate transport system substrate-binding protein